MNYLSVCSGIEAATTAWHALGFKPVAFSEIEPFPCAVLKHYWPDVPNLGSLANYRDWPMELLAQVDILVGGTPCQAFSFAGDRNGLADERGNLTLTFLHLHDRINEARRLSGRPPALCLWENVPGVLNTPDNAFGCFLAGLAGGKLPLQPPRGSWGSCGYVRGPKGAIAWRTLDAQYFGLAQRRERVFLIRSVGTDRPDKILFESEGVRRDSPPSRNPEKIPAGYFAPGTRERRIPDVAGTIGGASQTGGYRTTDLDNNGAFIPSIAEPITTTPYSDRGPDGNLLTARCVTTGEGSRYDFETTTLVTFSARARGDDGRGYARPEQVFGSEITGALDTVKPHCVAFKSSHYTRGKDGAPATITSPLSADADKGDQDTLVLAGHPDWQVRRLTPRECERLQGFPDDHTLIPYRGQPSTDSPRHKAIGNSMAVTVMAWLGRRILSHRNP